MKQSKIINKQHLLSSYGTKEKPRVISEVISTAVTPGMMRSISEATISTSVYFHPNRKPFFNELGTGGQNTNRISQRTRSSVSNITQSHFININWHLYSAVNLHRHAKQSKMQRVKRLNKKRKIASGHCDSVSSRRHFNIQSICLAIYIICYPPSMTVY